MLDFDFELPLSLLEDFGLDDESYNSFDEV